MLSACGKCCMSKIYNALAVCKQHAVGHHDFGFQLATCFHHVWNWCYNNSRHVGKWAILMRLLLRLTCLFWKWQNFSTAIIYCPCFMAPSAVSSHCTFIFELAANCCWLLLKCHHNFTPHRVLSSQSCPSILPCWFETQRRVKQLKKREGDPSTQSRGQDKPP